MTDSISIEIIGFLNSLCGPFPCTDDRSCGLEECYPSGLFIDAYKALETALKQEYGQKINLKVTLLDDDVPEYVKEIIEKHHPPVPIVLINGKVSPIGRISLNRVRKEINKI